MPGFNSPRIKFLRSTGEEKIYNLEKSRFTIGRSGENDLQTNDASVSRFHAEIVEEAGSYRLLDKKSKCGTFVNGERAESKILRHQDRIQLGNETQIVFLIGDETKTNPFSVSGTTTTFDSSPSIVFSSLQGSDLRNVSKLLETARAFSGSTSLQEILDVVLDTAIEITGAERAFLVNKDKDGESRFERGRTKRKESLGQEYFQVSQTILKQVLDTGEKVIISDIQGPKQASPSESMLNLELRTIVCLPLKALEIQDAVSERSETRRIIGALYLDGKKAIDKFSKISQGILDTLAADATAVIENARLLKESREKEKLEMELSTANEIQRTLLPSIRGNYGFFDACAFNIPSRHISGDCYDLIKMPDGSYGSMIGDVSGKGVSAALLCSMVQGLLYAEAMKHASPSECLEKVNSYLVQRTGGNKFVTLFYSILSNAGELRFVNAGHNPPILVHPEGSFEELYSGGVILGAFDFAKYQENTIYLRPGDLICLFTDGVTEARNQNGEMYGDEALQKILVENRRHPVEDIVSEIFHRVQNFSAGMAQSDDLSVYVLRYTPVSESEGAIDEFSPTESN